MKKIITFLAIIVCLNINAQIITTVAGNGTGGYAGDGGQATAAKLYYPTGVLFDAAGNMYIADNDNNLIRKVSTSGIITTIAGTGTAGYSGDGGQATAAELKNPRALAFDAVGNLYVAEAFNNTIRKINTLGIITTYAGNGTGSYSGDGGQATAAEIYKPNGVAFDAAGNLYIADILNHRIRMVNTLGIITTVAGNGTGAYSGDGGQATNAEIYNPDGITVDISGNLYIADALNNRIRRVSTSGIITTVAGNGTANYSGDGGQATAAEINLPAATAFDAVGNMYISDYENNRVREVSSSGIITTITGNGTAAYAGDGGQAISAEIYYPSILNFDAVGNLYIADQYNQRIRKISPRCQVTISGVTNLCSGNGTVLTASGVSSYTWSANAGSVNTNTVSLIPMSTTTYTLLSSDGVCSGIDTITVHITTTPTISLSGNTNICSGNNTTLIASGASSYTWNNGSFSVSTSSLNISPNSNTTFTVTAANGNCTDIDTITVHVIPTPTLNISGTTNICSGNGTILTASGATNYNWSANAGSATTNTVGLNPSANTTYTLTGANGLCAIITTISVSVTPTPTVAISGPTSVCSGNSIILTGSGATTYSWSANANDAVTNTITINPTSTDSYTLTGANGNCINNSIVTVTVIPLPIIMVNSDTICTGNQATLNATGASTYTWNPAPDFSNSSGSSVINSPTVTTTYTVMGTATTTCIGSSTVAVVVNSCSTTGVTKFSNDNSEINIYPNPNNGSFVVETTSNVKQTIQICDITGKVVLIQIINGKTNINANALSEGVYNLSVISNDGIINKRLIISH